MEPVLNKVTDSLDELAHKLEKIYHDTELDHKVEYVRLKTKDFIIRKPIESVGIGLVVGFVIGKLINRNH